MKPKFNIVSNWKDELIWCPSQCYLNITFEDRFFVIYLRWRWSDPWTATLVECDSDYDMLDKKSNWIALQINYYTDEQIEDVKQNAIAVAKKIICK